MKTKPHLFISGFIILFDSEAALSGGFVIKHFNFEEGKVIQIAQPCVELYPSIACMFRGRITVIIDDTQYDRAQLTCNYFYRFSKFWEMVVRPRGRKSFAIDTATNVQTLWVYKKIPNIC